jgi:hypothetical protein
MSARSIRAFQEQTAMGRLLTPRPVDMRGTTPRSTRPTLPAPPDFGCTGDQLVAQAEAFEAEASRLLARAEDLRELAAKRRGEPYTRKVPV